ncbi:hypothetical protein [Litchfieldia alkalitelluris]|nr:hypothetical protein [Litchfieldia alkalitelluris]
MTLINETQEKIEEIFSRIEILPEYAPTPIKITTFNWNQDVADFAVEYLIGRKKYLFHYNAELASELGTEYLNLDPIEQLEKELQYIKRMYERGIGSKEYYPFTHEETNGQ